MNSKGKLVEKVKSLGPWFHNINITDDMFTREINASPGHQPVNHPLQRWQALEPHLPASMKGLNVLDVGSADGYFSVEFARRGANVLAVDAAKKMIDRVKFLASEMNLSISTLVCSAEDMRLKERFDIIFNLGLLYHSRNPLLLLENLQTIPHEVMYLETAIAGGDEPYLYFKPPQEGLHHIPKWFPTKSCVIEMMRFIGYLKFEIFDYAAPDRLFIKAEK